MNVVCLLLCLFLPSSAPCPSGSTPQTLNKTEGVNDDFAPGQDPASPGPMLTALGHTYTGFDEPYWDKKFGHTITGLPCNSTSATLTLVLKAKHSLASNDSIGLQVTGGSPTFYWSSSLSTVLGQAWNQPGTVATLTLDLTALPTASGTYNLLNQINNDGYLDIYMQDDTSVDYIQLTMNHCVANDCNENGIDDSCESAGVLVCSGNVNTNLEAGSCCQTVTVSASYQSVCGQETYIIDNDYAPGTGERVSACFPPGITPVTFTLYTQEGNTQQCTVQVQVNDVTPPTITLCAEPQ